MQPLPFSVRDSVCGMEISPKNAAATSSYQGKPFTSVKSSASGSLMRIQNAFRKQPSKTFRRSSAFTKDQVLFAIEGKVGGQPVADGGTPGSKMTVRRLKRVEPST